MSQSFEIPNIDYSTRASIGLIKRIPSGFLHMGSQFHPREAPPKNVMVGEFQIGHVPVMVSQYQVFLMANGMNERKWWSPTGWAWRQGELEAWGRSDRSQPAGWKAQKSRLYHPITGITYYEAEAYCKWIADVKHVFAHLPTEEEWERAARGDDNRPYPWGEDFDPGRANTLDYGNENALPAGQMVSDISPFGIYDMAGNVQEWTQSAYTPLEEEVFPDFELRIARGGSFNDTSYGARASYRRGYPANYYFNFLSFRIAVGV